MSRRARSRTSVYRLCDLIRSNARRSLTSKKARSALAGKFARTYLSRRQAVSSTSSLHTMDSIQLGQAANNGVRPVAGRPVLDGRGHSRNVVDVGWPSPERPQHRLPRTFSLHALRVQSTVPALTSGSFCNRCSKTISYATWLKRGASTGTSPAMSCARVNEGTGEVQEAAARLDSAFLGQEENPVFPRLGVSAEQLASSLSRRFVASCRPCVRHTQGQF